ncbi:hypothetical protein ABB27_03260 [Stenotrophomonas terrae]|uniref:Uncharacterized protein n=1 Tax=Stenotrophomonas terrae TaxID=405446 RepID=A0A0R0CNR7_9GAMM|nr:hypothetical protein [Stenotrophomonas terrae]KRG71285.1 hypothetical protein ABB27_03260 [Stenotrophomonas terrae]
MASTRHLKGISRSLGETFISRNNDLAGYWGLGLLCLETATLADTSARFDLLARTSAPGGPISQALAANYGDVLTALLARADIQSSQLTSAAMEVRFGSFGMCATPLWTGRGAPYHCSIVLVSQVGKAYISNLAGYCAPHDPGIESRSTRANALPLRGVLADEINTPGQ